MEVQKYDLEICRDLAKSVGWKCLSTKYVDANAKLTWKCPEGHVQEIRTHYFKFMVSNSGGKCLFCHGMMKRKNSLHWLIQELSYHGLEKELFKELIQEAQERYDKEIENMEKSWESRIKKLVEKGIKEAKEMFDKEIKEAQERFKEDIKEYRKMDKTVTNIRVNGIRTGIRVGVENSKFLWNNMEVLMKRTNIPHEDVLKERVIQELYDECLKKELSKTRIF